MLIVLGLLIRRASDPEGWRWLVSDRGDDAPAAAFQDAEEAPVESAKKPADQQPAAEPRAGEPGGQPAEKPLIATGPTDQDPEESEYMKEAFQAVTDSTLENTKVEMAAYHRLVQWSLNQPFELMNRRAQRNVLATQLFNAPDEYRGKLIRLNLLLIRVLKWDLKIYDEGVTGKDAKPSKIVPVYEAWGTTSDSGAHPYNVILVDLPPGMPTGNSVHNRVHFVGYFFKVQKYYDGLHRVNRTPVLIGRADWQAPPTPGFQKTDWYISYGFVGGVLVIAVVSLVVVFLSRRRRKNKMVITGSRSAAMAVEDWIDKAGGGEPDEDQEGDSRHDVLLGEPKTNGEGSGNGKGFLRGLDVDHPPGE